MSSKPDLKDASDRLLNAARDYFNIMRKHNLAGGCIWLMSESGELVIFTRGEYKDQLMRQIEMDRKGPQYTFGTTDELEATS